MPPDPPISVCTSCGSSYKQSVPMLCPSNGDVLATPLGGGGGYTCTSEISWGYPTLRNLQRDLKIDL